jgi:hypothetical protein
MHISGVARKVMERLSSRPDDAQGYEAIVIDGHTIEEVDGAIKNLMALGLVNGWRVDRQPYGPPTNWYLASSLTPRGRKVLDGTLDV